MQEERITKLSKTTNAPVVALHKYNKLRSRVKDGFVFVLEGDDDPIFYTVAAQRANFNHNFSPLVVGGKDMVLGLRKLLSNSLEAEKGSGVAFFVDADFDGLKGHEPCRDTYVTPTYSIENIVCTTAALESLLNMEFKLHKDELYADIQPIVRMYLGILDKFHEEMKQINLLIYFGRTMSENLFNSRLLSIEKKSDSFFKIDKNTLTISCQCNDEKIREVIKFDNYFDLQSINSVSEGFEKLDPSTQWRGKFHFSFFIQLIQVLVEDRNTKNPKYFSKGNGKVKLNLATDSAFRILSSACEIPKCLGTFFAHLSANAFH